MLHVHLDPIGGAAGDMFAAALLDAFPDLREGALAAAQALAGVACQVMPHHDGTLTGLRFKAEAAEHHAHAPWHLIRTRIEASDLPAAARRHAIGIFTLLAEAEAAIHGTTPDEVTFHEVGAADSIADIVAAGWIVAALSPVSWSVGPLPLGTGRVETAHGVMPVPAPATAWLLRGFETLEDGIPGERVTPTGAAILRYLGCVARPPGVVGRAGLGFGTRRLNGLSNCLRALTLMPALEAPGHRSLGVITFEVDDQSGEDLAAGLDRIRAFDGVHDVLQMAAFGKKGRMTTHVQVLVQPARLDAAVDACFQETTTIGLRTHMVEGRALPRRFADVSVAGHPVRVKLAERPGGVTAKAEADHLRDLPGHAARTALRRQAEHRAITE